MLRVSAGALKALTSGRGVGLGCTLAARSIGKDGQLDFRLRGGGVFMVRTDDRYWLTYLLLLKNYENDLDHFLTRVLRAKDSFLDCGANLGLWSIAVSRVIDDARRVVAVEAGSRTFAQLERNWEANDRSFTTLHRAVGEISGERVSFFASVGDHASATMVQGLRPEDSKEEIVTTVGLLDLVAEQRILRTADDALIFVKLDIEGMERKIFATLDPADHGDLALLYEDHGSEQNHVTAFVLERGFGTAFLADDGSIEFITGENLHRLSALKTDSSRGYNMLAFVSGGAAAGRLANVYGRTFV
ncbi:FkbM family methyltransferase [Sphingomonas glaciei]|uniref:FkbM family methyltransferase n=1 Tax=Sphingomonas glaciei TaxID=2938948 RepID=A0ABY5MZ66_9SPHN|nr:FkbM family methyltransferase [Sphingomonas glaciei]UUR09442.1 FkbM family methyltransferase [Sphingomonas glaciei]